MRTVCVREATASQFRDIHLRYPLQPCFIDIAIVELYANPEHCQGRIEQRIS